MSGSESSHSSSFSLGFQLVPGHVPQNPASFKVFCIGDSLLGQASITSHGPGRAKGWVLNSLSENGLIFTLSVTSLEF